MDYEVAQTGHAMRCLNTRLDKKLVYVLSDTFSIAFTKTLAFR